jgi:hypothetical protein
VREKYARRVHTRVFLEGGYHVLDEAMNVASDVRAASKPPVGMLEVGIQPAVLEDRGRTSRAGRRTFKSSGSTDV